MDIKLERIAEKMSIETPCTIEDARLRVMRAVKMSKQSIHRCQVFIDLERQMVMRGINFSGNTVDDFWADNLKLQLFGMVFK